MPNMNYRRWLGRTLLLSTLTACSPAQLADSLSAVLPSGAKTGNTTPASSSPLTHLSGSPNATTQAKLPDRGHLLIRWLTSRLASVFSVQATKDDIAYFRITLDGESVRRINKSLPFVKDIPVNVGGQSLNNIPPGPISVMFEAYDKEHHQIGVFKEPTAMINAGQVTKLNVSLKLIDTVVEAQSEAPIGHLQINLNVIDGQRLEQKGQVIPVGSYFKFEEKVEAPKGCQDGVPDYTQSPENIVEKIKLPAPNSLNLGALGDTLTGSSASNDFLMAGMDLKQDLNNDLIGASASGCGEENKPPVTGEFPGPTMPPSLVDNILPTLPSNGLNKQDLPDLKSMSFDQPNFNLEKDQNLDLSKVLQLEFDNGIGDKSLKWTSDNPSAITVDSLGQIMILDDGIARITAQSSTYQVKAETTVAVKAVTPPTVVPIPFVPPTARLQVGKPQSANFQIGEQLVLDAADPKGDLVKFQWSVSGGGMNRETLEPNARFTLDREGVFNVSLKLIGKNGASFEAVNSPFLVKVQNPAPPPQVINITSMDVSPSSGNVKPSQPLNLDLTAQAQGNNLTYKWYDGTTLIATGAQQKVALRGAGAHRIILIVSAGDQEKTSQPREVVLTEQPNGAPQITAFGINPPGGQVPRRGTLSVMASASANDPESRPLQYQWLLDGRPIASGANATINPITPGNHDIKLVVTDPEGARAERNQTIAVTEQPNQSPQITAFGVRPGDVLNLAPGAGPVSQVFTATVTDPDGDSNTLRYQWFSNGTAIGNSANMPFSLSPGNHLIKVLVTDAEGASSEKEQLVSIRERDNQLPQIAGCSVSQESAQLRTGETLTVSLGVQASDPDGHTLQYQWTSNGGAWNGSNQANTSHVLGIPAGNNRATHRLQVKVSDGHGGSSTCDKTVTLDLKPVTYSYSASAGESTTGGGTFGNILRMRATVSGASVAFSLSKLDGTAFGAGTTAYLKVGDANGTTRSSTAVGNKFFHSWVDPQDTLVWPENTKSYYLRVENSKGFAFVGPITITRREQ